MVDIISVVLEPQFLVDKISVKVVNEKSVVDKISDSRVGNSKSGSAITWNFSHLIVKCTYDN